MARLDPRFRGGATQPPRVRAANNFLARVDTRALGPPLEFTLGPRERADPGAGDDTVGAN
jgi:hypothetical protein